MSGLKWISWENHQRTEGICDYLCISPVVIICRGGNFKKYFCQLYRTLQELRKEDVHVLIVQNPSLVLTAFSLFFKLVFHYKLVVDAHNEAVQPYLHNGFLIRFVSGRLLKYADITIVTNKYLADIVKAKGGTPLVLPDRIPNKKKVAPLRLSIKTVNVVLIATYAADEPVVEVINAARKLGESVTLYITGNYSKLDKSYIDRLPVNIKFTGYLSSEDYWSLLSSVSAIIDLTSMDNCLVCGAYEGLSVGKPMMLSNNKATVDYFSKGVVYTDNTAEDIHRAFMCLVDNHAAYKDDVMILANELNKKWYKMANDLKEVLGH